MSKKRNRRSLWFHLYHSGLAHTLIGEAEMQLSDLSARPITTWLALSDSRHNKSFNWGELMICLSYLPTAERLTVVVVKVKLFCSRCVTLEFTQMLFPNKPTLLTNLHHPSCLRFLNLQVQIKHP